MKSFFNKIQLLIQLGVTDSSSNYEKRSVSLINLFSILTITGLIIGGSNIVWMKAEYPLFISLFLLFNSILTIVLNAFRKYFLSLVIWVFGINAAVFYFNEYYSPIVAAHLFYFPLIFCIALLHSSERGMKQTGLLMGLTFALATLSIFVDFPQIRNSNITPEQSSVLFNYNLSFCVFLTMVLVITVINIFDSQNRKLSLSVQQLQHQQSKVSHSLKEKEIMLSEIHHRVKNNLAVVGSLLNLQMSGAKSEEARQLLNESKNRVHSIALVHEKLYRKKDFSKIDFENYIEELCLDLVKTSSTKNKVALKLELIPCQLPISLAVPLGLIVNEIVTNSFKHGFNESDKEPYISIKLQFKQADVLELSIRDNGKGFDFEGKKGESDTLGLTLITSLIEQIDAQYTFVSKDGAGFVLDIPLNQSLN